MHHFGEMTAADRSGQHQTGVALRLQCLENRAGRFEILLAAAHHQRISAIDAPHAAGNAAVHEPNALAVELCRMTGVVGIA